MSSQQQMAEKKSKKRCAAAAASTAVQTTPQAQPDPEVTALLETLMSRTEKVLVETESLRDYSTHNTGELTRLLAELSAENRALREKYRALACEMQDAMEVMEGLRDTQYAQDSKTRQARKLSRQF
ncbi:hypothetical protein AALO_G00108480 [Alosa alosa]|uniref:Uncharacterized protein n=1 Tax=Alosa alosa TaxID=278164 RepID=A0AAV6GSM3_9TELE|nr:hypothetical protein AALO_G00108480 [Alosa alosa]